MESRESNHEIMKRQMQLEFLKYDQGKMVEKFNLESDEDYIYLEFVHYLYRVNRYTGYVEWSEDDFKTCQEADYNEAMTIYDLLCYSKEECKASGEYTQMQNLSKVVTSNTYAGNGMLDPYAKFYDHKEQELTVACKALGGAPEGKGDVAYKIPIFEDLKIIIQFWNSDDEFPASLQIFCDINTLDYMHYETIWYMALHVLKRLQEQ